MANLSADKMDLSQDSSLINLTPKQRQKLYLHECCAHENFHNLNRWIRHKKFPNVDPSLANEPDPLCAICQFSKARKRTHKANVGNIRSNHTAPGQGVSSDGMEAGTPGRTFTTKGLPINKRYKYVSFWVDHMSSFTYATFHTSKDAKELLASKHEFEQWSAKFGVKIQSIRADNGVYAAQVFCQQCEKQQQDLTFCAVGAHWQNGIAERFIGLITTRARTILLHAMSKWPDTITEDMWPFALRHAINFHNVSIRRDQSSTPYQLFTGQDAPWNITDFRIFGCPAYVLHKDLQDDKKVNKWQSRSWRGVYIGNSSCHAGSIPLIYNPHTTHISPQYHIVYNEYFKTATGNDTFKHSAYLDKLLKTSTHWIYKDRFTDDPYIFEEFWSDSPHNHTISPTQPRRKRKQSFIQPQPELPLRGSSSVPATPQQPHKPSLAAHYMLQYLPDIPEAMRDQFLSTIANNPNLLHHNSTQHNTLCPNKTLTEALQAQGTHDDKTHHIFQASDSDAGNAKPGLTRPPTVTYEARQGTTSWHSYKKQRLIGGNIHVLIAPVHFTHVEQQQQQHPLEDTYNIFSAFPDLPFENPDLLLHAYPAVDSKADTLTQSQMLKDPESSKFVQAQHPEIAGLQKMEVFDIKPMALKPKHAKLLSSIWSYKRKRSPIRIIMKYKARLCVDGSQQEHGRDYWETYAPVVSWSTIRLVLLLFQHP